MTDNIVNPFEGDAFEMAALTAALNEIDHVPGRAGDLCFAKVGQGVSTTTVAIERKSEALTLLQTSTRGAPAPKELQDKRKLFEFDIPHIKLEDTIHADSFQNVREFGTGNLIGPERVINQQLEKMARRFDLTLEFHRLGALKGEIKDADGSTLVDLFSEFEILNDLGQPEPDSFDFDLANPNTDVRVKAQEVTRKMRRKLKLLMPSTAVVWAFCGNDFFDALIAHPNVKDSYRNVTGAPEALGGNFAFGVFEHGGIFWENYYGTDDGEGDSEGGTVGIATDEARFFFVGVPDLYAEYYAPADFLETVNTPGLPRYAKVAPDKKFNQFAELHTQQNPLPLCLRPQTLMRATA